MLNTGAKAIYVYCLTKILVKFDTLHSHSTFRTMNDSKTYIFH